MTTEDQVFLIPKIRSGIVIDHIPSGLGLRLVEIIRSYPGMADVVTSVGFNYSSQKLGKKDLIKLQTEDLDERILQHISLVSPGISIKRITNYVVDKKYVLRPPELLDNLVACHNPNCVTSHENNMATRFRQVDSEGTLFRCEFCERVFHIDELRLLTPERQV